MGIGIQICGLNGCGKSTLGRALADRMGFHFIDNENLYFVRSQANEPYANPRSQEEVERLLMDEVAKHPNLYKQEEAFFRMVESRQDDYIENRLQSVKCPIIRVDGTKAVEENVEYIIRVINT